METEVTQPIRTTDMAQIGKVHDFAQSLPMSLYHTFCSSCGARGNTDLSIRFRIETEVQIFLGPMGGQLLYIDRGRTYNSSVINPRFTPSISQDHRGFCVF